MSDLIKKVKIHKQDGTYTDYIPIGAEASNVFLKNNEDVETAISKIVNSTIDYVFLSNYDNFDDAISDAHRENKILLIDKDVYFPSDYTISKSVSIEGKEGFWIILNKDSKTHLNIAANDIYLNRVNIKTLHDTDEALPNLGVGLSIIRGSNIIIKDCNFYKLSYAIWMKANQDDIIENVFIIDNNIEKCELGILCGPRITLESNVTSEIKNILISRNHIHDGIGEVNLTSARDGVKLTMRTYNVVIANNIIHGMKGDGIDCYTSGDTFIVVGNEIFNNHLNGMELKNGGYDPLIYGYNQNCQISNNIFYDNGNLTEGFSGVDIEFAFALDETGIKQYSYRNAIISNNVFRSGTCAIDIQTNNIIIDSNVFNGYTDKAVRVRNARPAGVQSVYNIQITNNIFNECVLGFDANVKTGIVEKNIFDAFSKDIPYAIVLSSSTIRIGDNTILNYSTAPISGSAGQPLETVNSLIIPIGASGIRNLILVPNKNVSFLSMYYVNNTNVSASTTDYAIVRARTDSTILNTCTINSNYTKENKLYAPSSIKNVTKGTPIYLEHINYGSLNLETGWVVINYCYN